MFIFHIFAAKKYMVLKNAFIVNLLPSLRMVIKNTNRDIYVNLAERVL